MGPRDLVDWRRGEVVVCAGGVLTGDVDADRKGEWWFLVVHEGGGSDDGMGEDVAHPGLYPGEVACEFINQEKSDMI